MTTNADTGGCYPYSAWPDHALAEVPIEVLEAAREVLRMAVVWKDVDKDFAEPIADAVVMALAEAGYLRVPPNDSAGAP